MGKPEMKILFFYNLGKGAGFGFYFFFLFVCLGRRGLIHHTAFVKGYVVTSEGAQPALNMQMKKKRKEKKQLSFIIKHTGGDIIRFV